MIIKQFYAWMCVDERGNEFPVMAAHQENPGLPFVLGGYNEEMAMSYRPLAEEIAKASGKQLTLVKYESRRCVLNLEPKASGTDRKESL